jgi:hypothetical protein
LLEIQPLPNLLGGYLSPAERLLVSQSQTEEAYVSYHPEIELLLINMRYEFHKINADDQLTEADKKQLKEFYLQNMIAPKARKLLEKHFPEEFKTCQTAGTSTPSRRTP